MTRAAVDMLVREASDAVSSGKVALAPQPGPQEKFLSASADIAVYGGAAGAGKSYALLIDPLRYRDRPGFSAVIFRRTYPQIMAPGGLWDTSAELYPKLGATARESTAEWTFRSSGVRVKFAHMQYEDDCVDWDGAQVAFIGFDQLEHFTWKQFFYLVGRNRTMCGIKAYVRATCNPDPDHWLRKFMSWWIDDETGLPIPERSGVVRWFAVVDDVVYWGDDVESCVAGVRASRGDAAADECEPKSFTFIAGTVEDNRVLLASNPGYLANLNALPPALKERFRSGNWNAKEGAGEFFDRTWFEVVRSVPSLVREIRYWDRAATEVKAGEVKKASWTVGCRQGRAESGVHFITHVERFQRGPLGVETAIKNTATQDGRRVVVGVEGDPGQAGVAEAQSYQRLLGALGFTVLLNYVRESKAARARGSIEDIDLAGKGGAPRARPYSAYAQAGNVKLLDGPWVEEFLREHERFDGTRSCVSDQVDSASGGYYMLSTKTWGKALTW